MKINNHEYKSTMDAVEGECPGGIAGMQVGMRTTGTRSVEGYLAKCASMSNKEMVALMISDRASLAVEAPGFTLAQVDAQLETEKCPEKRAFLAETARQIISKEMPVAAPKSGASFGDWERAFASAAGDPVAKGLLVLAFTEALKVGGIV